MIDTIIFDIGNVLMKFDFFSFLDKYYADEQGKVVQDAVFDAFFASGIWNELDRGEWEEEAVLDAAIARQPDFEEELRFVWDRVGESMHREDFAIPWITELKERGYRVLYLSNYSSKVMNAAPEVLDFIPYTDGGVFSCYARCIKPEPGIFETLRDNYELDFQTCVFLDDTLANIEAAEEFGLTTIHVENHEQAVHDLELVLAARGIHAGTDEIDTQAPEPPASIFNDVIGPVMRGPSSSHVAGGARIASLVRQTMHGKVVKAVVDFDPTGSLAASHDGHGTDMGFACGLMNIPLTSSDVDQYNALAKAYGLDIEYRIIEYNAVHPSNYRMELTDATGLIRNIEAIALGGGMVELQQYEGFEVKICGDFYELLLIFNERDHRTTDVVKRVTRITGEPEYVFGINKEGSEDVLVNIKMSRALSEKKLNRIKSMYRDADISYLEPVLPTHSRRGCTVPYSNAEELLAAVPELEFDEAWKYAARYEACRGGITEEQVFEEMSEILSIMEGSVDNGLAGTEYKDRILGTQSPKIDEASKAGKLVPMEPLNSVIKSITAIMESKSSMGLIVAAPTCGACGCMAGTIVGLGRALELSRDEMIKGLLVAGLVGVFFTEQATFSAEVGGCQVECGAGSGMAAAAVTQMMGGSIEQCIDAASLALQNITGLACDPVGNRVEVPCLGKNVMGGSNAISSANMILAGYDKVIPLDETIHAIYEIGKSLPLPLRCTYGGLGSTRTAQEILRKTERHFEEE